MKRCPGEERRFFERDEDSWELNNLVAFFLRPPARNTAVGILSAVEVQVFEAFRSSPIEAEQKSET